MKTKTQTDSKAQRMMLNASRGARVLAYLDGERFEHCEHGHMECAATEGGACSDELHHLAVDAKLIDEDGFPLSEC